MRLPNTSDREATGRLIMMPGIVEADATIPSRLFGVPKLVAKGLSTGFLDMVELRIAKKAKAQRIMKKAFCVFEELNMSKYPRSYV